MAHVAQVTLLVLEWGQGDGSEGTLFLAEFALELSAPARQPEGAWSLGTPAKPEEVRQSESGLKGMFSSRNS